MKKITLFIIAATLLSIAAQAQTDTIHRGQHDPNYYYYWPGYGPWIDQMFVPTNYSDSTTTMVVTTGVSPFIMYTGMGVKETFIRPCYTDRPLSVIGVAAPLKRRFYQYWDRRPDGPFRIWDTVNLPQESFVLYEWNGTRPVFVDSACWTCTTPRYVYPDIYERGLFMYEAYFDKPHEVIDTFYVGLTNNSFYNIEGQRQGDPYPLSYIAYPPAAGICDVLWGTPKDLADHGHKPTISYCIPKIAYTFDSLTLFYYPLYALFTDTSAIAFPMTSQDASSFPYIFPIIDTTGVNFDDLYEGWDTIPGLDSILHMYDCPRVSHLRPGGMGHGCVNMAWRGDSCHAAYQLKYGKFFDPEENYRQYDVTGNNIYIDVDSNVLYKVMVRGRCGCGLTEWSPWSSTMFLLTAYNATVVDSNQLRLDEGLEMLTTVSPNPAHGKATVFSSLHIRSIDVYSADGHRLDHINVGGLSHELDLSRYAKGLCLLKINTYRGTTVRKLIVE